MEYIRRKKIMIIHSGLVIGGMEKMITSLANFLCEEFEIIFLLLETEKHNFILNEKITIIEKNYNLNISLKSMGVSTSISLVRNISREIRRYTEELMPDMIIVFNDRITFLTWLAVRKRNIKLLMSQRADPNDKSAWINKVLKYVYHHCDGVVFQLEQVKKYYSMVDQCRVIPNPAFIDIKKDHPERRKKIISIGRLQYRKRMDLVILAFREVLDKYSDYELYIFGDGEERSNLENLVRSLGIHNKVHFMGFVQNAAEKNLDAEMFVMASDSEGIPNTLIEAMAAGIPCIATDCSPGGASLLLNHGENGILVRTGNVSELAQGMITYIENKELKEKNTVKAQKYLENFSAGIIYDKWKTYIYEIFLENEGKQK